MAMVTPTAIENPQYICICIKQKIPTESFLLAEVKIIGSNSKILVSVVNTKSA